MKQTFNLRQRSAEFLATTPCPMRERVSRLVGTGKGLLLFFLFFGLGVSQEVMADADMADVGVVFSVNSNTEKYYIHNAGWLTCNNCTDWTIKNWTAYNAHNFGNVTSFKLKGIAVSGWRSGSDWFAAKIFYKIYADGTSEPSSNTGEFGVGGYGETGGNPNQYKCEVCYNSDGSNKSVIGIDNQNVDLIGSRTPGVYNMKIFTNAQKRYNGGSWGTKTDYTAVTATFTIPGFTTTSTSKAYGNVAINSETSSTISFGTHYGTALTTSDCSITGDGTSSYAVTAISESGVTVKFNPTSAGSKPATLTITDAHSKTCTISLSGTVPTYTITLSKNGGVEDGTASVTYGNTEVTSITKVTRTGYNCSGYYTATTGGTKVLGASGAYAKSDITGYITGGKWSKADNCTLYAQWTPKTTTITVNPNDGSSATYTKSATYDADAPTWTADSRSGYTIKGYYSEATSGSRLTAIDKDGNSYFTHTSWVDSNGKWIKASSTVSIFAQWATNYTIKLYPNGGSGSTLQFTGANAPYNVTAALQKVTPPTRNGYNFRGYSYNSNPTLESPKIIDENGNWLVVSGYTTQVDSKIYWTKDANRSCYAIWELIAPSNPSISGEAGYKPGDNISLTASATGAELTYQWYKNDVIIDGATSATYTKESCVTGDAGTYKCVITNGAGSVNATKVVKVDANVYTITIAKNNDSYGQVSQSTVSGVPEGTVVTFGATGNLVVTDVATVTATPTTPSAQYTYAFEGWESDDYTTGGTVTKDGTITANFSRTLNTYTITFNPNDGVGSMDAQTDVSYGVSTQLNTMSGLSRTGYTFAGWATSASGSVVYADGANITITGNTELFAKWNPITYTVAFDGNGGSGTAPASINGTYDQALTALPANPFTKTGYDFGGWNTKQDGSGDNYAVGATPMNLTTTSGAIVTLYAKWTIHNYTISWPSASTGWSYGAGERPATAHYGDPIQFEVNTTEGYTVTVASPQAVITKSGKDCSFTMPASDVTVNVSATENLYDVTLNCDIPAGATLSYDGADKEWGSVVSVGVATTKAITVTLKPGYKFNGSFTTTGGARAVGNSGSYTISANGAKGTVTAKLAEDLSTGYTVKGSFDSWAEHAFEKASGHSTESKGYYTYNLAAGTTYEFGIVRSSDNYYYKNGGTYQSSNSGQEWTFPNKSNLDNCKLVTTVAGDYIFAVDYSSDSQGNENIKVSITYPTSYKVNFGVGDGGSSVTAKIDNTTSISTGDLVLSGSSVTFHYTAESGYRFTGWYTAASGGNLLSSTDADYVTTISAVTNVYAQFEEIKHTVTVSAGANGSIDPAAGDYQIGVVGQDFTATGNPHFYLNEWVAKDGAAVSSTTAKTTHVTATDNGTVTANFAPKWVLKGYFNNWHSTSPFGNWDGNVGYVDVELDGDSVHHFKVYFKDENNEIWYGNNGTMTMNDCSGWTFETGKNNCGLTPTVAGTYRFTIDTDTKEVSVTYPVSHVVNFSKTPAEGSAGAVTAVWNTKNLSSGDRVADNASVTFTAPDAATSYHFVRWVDGNDVELSTDNPYTVSNIAADITVKAVYGGTTFAVTISSDAQGTVDPSGVQQVDNIAGTQITATATTAGYVFDRWETTGDVILTGALTDNPNTVKATGKGTVTAKYKQAQVVYFKNTLGWSNVYVYIFNQTNVSDPTKGVCPKYNRVAYAQMALAQGETDVYVYTYDGALADMKSIAFCKDAQPTHDNFDNTEAAYRSDYNAANPMFVPQTTSNETKNVHDGYKTLYYSTGTWFPFNTNKNYYIKFSDSETQYPLVFTTAGSLEATIGNINLTAYTTYTFTLYDNAHPIDAQPVAYGREEEITYNKDNEYVSFTNTTDYPATLKTITGGNHTFSANFNSDVRPQIRIDFPTAYTLDYGVAPGGQSATAVRTGTTDTIASGAYVAPGQSVTLTQTAAAGCSFHSWNTKADGTGTNLSSDATYTFTMPAGAHTAYALYNGADVPSSFQILGTFNNWASTSYMRSKSVVGELVYDSIYLEAGREYKFKVHNTSGSKWYGNTGIMTQAHCTQWTFTEGTGNCTLATTIAGWYKFTLNKSSISLNVTFPENEKQATMYDSPVRSNNTDVMIQAFYWAHEGNTGVEYTAYGDVKWAALNAEADTLAKYFDMVWLAPSQETADFTGYLPINYSQQGSVSTSGGHSPWGTSAQLRTLIDNLHRGGSKVIADIVINHSSAAHPDEGATVGRSWCEWGSFDFGRYGVYNPDYTWLAKGDEMFYAKKTQAGECGLLDNTDNYEDEWNYSYKGGTGSWSESEFNCAYSRDWAHKKQEIREMSRAYLTWMRDSIGYDGWRYDFVKGFHGSHLYDYNRSTGAYFSVAEVFDGDIDKQLGVLADAGRETYMFDFPGKFSIYNGAIRTYSMKDLKGNYNTLIGNNANKRYAVTFIDNHDSFHEGSSLYGTPNVIDDRQAQQAICYLFSMPGVPCLVYPYWNTYKEIVKKVIYARKAAGVHSESVIEEDWAGDGSYGNNHYTARIKGKHGYIFLKMGYDCRPQDLPMGGKDPDGRTWIKAWANDNAGVWYTTSDTEPAKYRLLITANGQTYYSNDVNRNGQTLSFYATPDAKYQWQKYEMFQWKDCPGTAPVALTSYVYTATFDSVNMAATDMDLYDGDYYIRTDAVGWNDYKKDNHKFTYFANASVAAGDAYHYYWVKNIAKSSQVNVHATVGNEYNEHVTNTLGNDQFTDSEGKVEGDNNGINIRFSYEPTTNYLGRAMILGSTNNKYLNVVGSNIYKEKACTTPLDESHYSSTPADSKLGDISDWVYERVVFVKITDAKPSSNVVIKSVFKTTPSSAEQTQYMLGFQRDFYGNLTDDPVQYAVLDAGTTKSETTAYCIRVIYDFKTNRLVGAWEPVDQVVTDDWNIDADVLFKRFENGNTAQITFAKEGDTISSLKNVLFIMEFHRDTLAGQENLYWFSLPYDCNISSIYGVEGYVTLDNSGLPTKGTWGIQRYDGETRAKTGWFKEDTKTFWKWMGKDEVLHAGEGYVLDFDKSCATFNEIEVEEVNPSTGEVTKVKKSILRLYFPSDKPGFSMTKSGAVDSVVYTDHTCNIKNRKAQDSNWRLMSPGNYSNTTIANEKDIRYDEKDSVLTAIPAFIYRYDRSKDAGSRYTAVSALNGFTYKSFNCYMAQFSGAVKWAQYTKADATTVAARQYYAPGEIRLANLKLVMENSYGEQQDHTFIKLKKGATTGYDANADLTKIVNSGIGQVYSVSEDVDYAANVLPIESQTVALKVVAAKAGSYTFSMPEGTDGVTATLVDTQTGSRTDLSLWNYTVELGKDTYVGRFYLDINIHQTPTNVVVTEGDSENEGDKMMKFIENGQLYILKNGVIYDATGKIVK